MAQINTKTTAENLHISFQFNEQGTDLDQVKDIKVMQEAGPAIVREPDFAELHALFEIQYEQFLMDTSNEIAKHAQRLLGLESIVYGDPSCE
jgi:hypothetical protein